MNKRVRTTRRLEVWLKDTSVALFVLNAHRRLVFFNAGCEELTGWTAPDLLGKKCDFTTTSDVATVESLLTNLAAPGDVWSGKSVTAPVYLSRRQGDPVSCFIHYYPLTDANQKVQATLAVIQQEIHPVQRDRIAAPLQLHAELAALRTALKQQFSEDLLIGRSSSMRKVFGQAKLAQSSIVPVHFVGEEGTGRESLARTIHYGGATERGLFVPLDCQKLPMNQLDYALRRSIEQSADSEDRPGVVYLRNVEALPRDLQRLLLDTIESKDSGRPRFMSASVRPLQLLVDADDFITDLYFALTGIEISVPPLRNRTEDLEPLAQFFVEELNRDSDKQLSGLHDEVLERFRRYNWPGNVRELRSVVSKAWDACTGTIIEIGDLPMGFRAGEGGQSIGPATRSKAVPLDPLLLKVEKEQIELALVEARHNKARAAELLGITRPRLYRRMEVLGIADQESETNNGPVE